ncbi:TNF receptor-associated factor 6-like isoform X2 [Dermacentor silvarum]|uniref:TNF receptor-associated factor 6-like isoform X2 n=1 Tax=Dermacentor silvarum TaxID=543639 RepID=UPI0021017E7A|nr:TNF receptor-associated factor 6-like isoform X2 [Dermacentor silvarum]
MSTDAPCPMAFQTQRCTVFGFSQELDWRPLYFAEPIPAHRICDGCGLLPRVTVFLPCRHVLCKTCYEQCVVDDQHSCPLDGDAFLDEDVQWGDFPLENLLKRKSKLQD